MEIHPDVLKIQADILNMGCQRDVPECEMLDGRIRMEMWVFPGGRRFGLMYDTQTGKIKIYDFLENGDSVEKNWEWLMDTAIDAGKGVSDAS